MSKLGKHEELIEEEPLLNESVSTSNLQVNSQHINDFLLSPKSSMDFDIELGSSEPQNKNNKKKKSRREQLVEFKNNLLYQNVGIKLMVIAQAFGSGMAATTRLLETTTEPPMKPTQVLFARMLITYLCCLAYMIYNKIPDPVLGPKGVRLLLTLRGVFGFFGVFGFYYALIYLDLSDATVIGFLNPVVTGFLAWICLGEVFGSIEIRGGIASLIGVIIIARPSFLLTIFNSNSDANVNPDTVEAGKRLFGIAMSLVGVLASALTFVVIRKIGDRAHPLMSVSYFALWCVIVSTAVLLFMPGESFSMPQTPRQWWLLIALGMFGFIFQFMLTAAIQRETAAVVTSIGYSSILWALLWERLFWGSVPDLLSWIGGSFILGSAIWMAYSKYRLRKVNGEEREEDKEDEEEEEEILEMQVFEEDIEHGK